MADRTDLQEESDPTDTHPRPPAVNLNAVADRLTLHRLSKYLTRCDNDVAAAIELYVWNNRVAASLNSTLQHFEVCLRNSISLALVDAFGVDWFKAPKLVHYNGDISKEADKATAKATENRNGFPITAPDFIAASTMNIWRELCKPSYAGLFWSRRIPISFPNHPAAGGKGAERKILEQIHRRVDLLLKLRNRIAHHEPIIGSNRDPIGAKLCDRHSEMTDLLVWMDLNFARWVGEDDRFPQVLKECPVSRRDDPRREG